LAITNPLILVAIFVTQGLRFDEGTGRFSGGYAAIRLVRRGFFEASPQETGVPAVFLLLVRPMKRPNFVVRTNHS